LARSPQIPARKLSGAFLDEPIVARLTLVDRSPPLAWRASMIDIAVSALGFRPNKVSRVTVWLG
jgi:hypothetical protein